MWVYSNLIAQTNTIFFFEKPTNKSVRELKVGGNEGHIRRLEMKTRLLRIVTGVKWF